MVKADVFQPRAKVFDHLKGSSELVPSDFNPAAKIQSRPKIVDEQTLGVPLRMSLCLINVHRRDVYIVSDIIPRKIEMF